VLREFENYGTVKSIKMVKDKAGKPRGYCFIEYEKERDMRSKQLLVWPLTRRFSDFYLFFSCLQAGRWAKN